MGRCHLHERFTSCQYKTFRLDFALKRHFKRPELADIFILNLSLEKLTEEICSICSKVWIMQVQTAAELKAVGPLDPLGSRGPTG